VIESNPEYQELSKMNAALPSRCDPVPCMPCKYSRSMTDTELMAIRAYLMSLPKLETIIP
jgi:hypothetical protein